MWCKLPIFCQSGENYFTFRLVASQRIGAKVRQRTLLSLGRNFSLPKEQWSWLCARIDLTWSSRQKTRCAV